MLIKRILRRARADGRRIRELSPKSASKTIRGALYTNQRRVEKGHRGGASARGRGDGAAARVLTQSVALLVFRRRPATYGAPRKGEHVKYRK